MVKVDSFQVRDAIAERKKEKEKMPDLPVLLCTMDEALNQGFSSLINTIGFNIVSTSRQSDVINFFDEGKRALLLLDTSASDSLAIFTLAKRIRSIDRRTPIICLSNHKSDDDMLAALRVGIKDYFYKPFDEMELIDSIKRLMFEYRSRQPISSSLTGQVDDGGMIGESLAFQKIRTLLLKFSKSNCHVLITGETGTGKEVAAKFIHDQGLRRDKSFVSINCAAIPEALFESELFGFERGAFTGAQSSHEGRMRLANGGTLFLDEIGEMNLLAQAKLLRVLETKEVFPLGGKRYIPLDVRIIAATNCNLEKLVLENRFRRDLYFRLNIARVHLPSLRERKEDISKLVSYYILKLNQGREFNCQNIHESAWKVLLEHDWPGNIRELRNVIESMFLEQPSEKITVNDLPEYLRAQHQSSEFNNISELNLLLITLDEVNWNKSKAAKALNWSRMTLYRKMAKYRIVY